MADLSTDAGSVSTWLAGVIAKKLCDLLNQTKACSFQY